MENNKKHKVIIELSLTFFNTLQNIHYKAKLRTLLQMHLHINFIAKVLFKFQILNNQQLMNEIKILRKLY